MTVSQQWIEQEQAEASRWAQALLGREFVVFDCETTGLEADDEIVQVGLVDQHGRVLMNQLVKPLRRISPEASAVHGLTLARLFGAPSFPDLYHELALLLNGMTVVTYNAEFDARLLEQTCHAHHLPPIQPAGWQCAMMEYARYRGLWNLKRQSFRRIALGDACDYEGIDSSDAHSAVGDSLMTLGLLRRMARVVERV